MNLKNSLLVNRTQIYKLGNTAGLSFSIYENGSIHTIEQGSVQMNLLTGSPLEAGCANIYLRIRGRKIVAVPLIGPQSPGIHYFGENFFGVKGEFNGISFSCRLLLAEGESSWFWDVRLTNTGSKAVEADLIYVQDVGLIPTENGESNEFYISQYIDYTELNCQEHGKVVCCRQSEHVPDSIPWLALGSLGLAESFSTDGTQFFGSQYREAGIAKCLSSLRLSGLLQKESAVVALQEKPFVLKPQSSQSFGFFGVYCDHHASPTDLKDLDFVHSNISWINMDSHKAWPEQCISQELPQSLFSETPLFVSDDLTEKELVDIFGKDQRHRELLDGELLSFFYGENRHVVLRRKELMVERPHGHIMKSGTELVPEDSSMSSTAYMFGVFHSQVSQGNVNFNHFLTVNTNPFNLIRHTGQRIFVKLEGQYQQLGVPSAFEIGLHSCRWIYKQANLMFEVMAWACPDCPEVILHIHVLEGPELEWLVSNQLDSENKWSLTSQSPQGDANKCLDFVPAKESQLAQLYPGGSFTMKLEYSDRVKQTGGDELLFADGKSRGMSFAVIEVNKTKDFGLRLCGNLVESKVLSDSEMEECEIKSFSRDSRKSFSAWQKMSSELKVNFSTNTSRNDIDEIFEILPWFSQNAQIHYLAPHGLEQYAGAAWGTRDICQGPLEMLLSLGHFSQARNILCRIFSNQNSDGNWVQWWMFDRYNGIRSSDSHGDIIFWPILALSEYVAASGDCDFLDEQLPFYNGNKSDDKRVSVLEHVLQCFEHIELNRFANGSSLVNYSEGDWNDSMQPANPKLKDRLISSWTVGLSYQAFKRFAEVCRVSQRNSLAEKIEARCDLIRADFNKFLLKDDVVAGFGYLKDKNTMDLLLHPSDSTTGISYRLLPMIRGIISEIFSPEQARHHADLIEKYLKGPDGARLMDHPPLYHGGVQQYFKRAESSPYFGREIGLMYTHAHLRYAEAMAKLGCPEAFVKALRQIIPIRIQEIIPQANLRQSNCYYSSSDANVSSRHEVNKSYEDIKSGKVTLNGGWRIYSSGPGIVVRLIISYLLGIRHEYGKTIFDPVLPQEFDGLTVQVEFRGRNVTIVYAVNGNNKGVTNIAINGTQHPFELEVNPYRSGGAMIEDSRLWAALNQDFNRIEITL
jgi:1,2-beta-oligoglucan phosphorylase